MEVLFIILCDFVGTGGDIDRASTATEIRQRRGHCQNVSVVSIRGPTNACASQTVKKSNAGRERNPKKKKKIVNICVT